jgi:hypothetical protein
MKTFLKIVLVVVLTVVALKLSPLLALGALIGLAAAGVLGAVGLSLVGVLLAVAIALAVALSPIWVPVLIVTGLVSLFRSPRQSTPPATVA